MTSRVLVSPKKKRSSGCVLWAKYDSKLSWSWSYYAFFCAEYKGGNKKMKQPKLTLIFDGEPNINALPESEQRVFYTTLLERIFELHRAKEQGQAKK